MLNKQSWLNSIELRSRKLTTLNALQIDKNHMLLLLLLLFGHENSLKANFYDFLNVFNLRNGFQLKVPSRVLINEVNYWCRCGGFRFLIPSITHRGLEENENIFTINLLSMRLCANFSPTRSANKSPKLFDIDFSANPERKNFTD